MKKFRFQFIIFLTLISGGAGSQNLIAVQNGNTQTFYSTLDLAVTNSQNGDTIYLPGGTFTISIPIDKRLHIIGVGHNPDSSQAIGFTTLNGSTGLITFNSNANYGSICGVNIGPILFNVVNDFLIKRCRTSNISFNPWCENFIFIENVIGNLSPNAKNCFLLNNIIEMGIGQETCSNSVYKNNIFTYNAWCAPYSYYIPIYSFNSIIENNIFISNSYCNWASSSTGSFFNNNLFVENWVVPGNCFGTGNIINQPQTSIFINQSGNNFNYDHDYHLQATSPGINAGTDGTDIGIYGGSHPWKDGSIPFNPHIQYKTISGSTDENGNLNVNIKVSAQDH